VLTHAAQGIERRQRCFMPRGMRGHEVFRFVRSGSERTWWIADIWNGRAIIGVFNHLDMAEDARHGWQVEHNVDRTHDRVIVAGVGRDEIILQLGDRRDRWVIVGIQRTGYAHVQGQQQRGDQWQNVLHLVCSMWLLECRRVRTLICLTVT